MSNPAVVKLASGKVGKSKVWLDDNFGESIHLHIDDIRIDLTTQEFAQLYEDLCDILNDLIGIKELDFRSIDPVYLSVMLWSNLPHLKLARIDKVNLDDLYAPYRNRIFKLKESVGVKSLNGIYTAGSDVRKSNHISQTDGERMMSIMESVKTNGYPYNNQYIILYGDDNIIRDGQHRASCLYFLQGNISVPVLRLYFDNYKSPSINKYYNSFPFVSYRKVKNQMAKSYHSFIGFLKKLVRLVR